MSLDKNFKKKLAPLDFEGKIFKKFNPLDIGGVQERS